VAKETDVLIVGAGPTGLVLALWLTHLGVRVRIVDKTAQPGTTSRALVMHARILEQYDQLGLAQDVIDRSLKFEAANFWVKGRQVARAQFGDMGKGVSPFPFSIVFPQDAHEKFLVERLRSAGIEVERTTELASFASSETGARARLKRAGGSEETCECAYIAGCDGTHSTVREAIGAGFPGGTYNHLFYVADVKASGPVVNRELNVALDEADFVAMFPLVEPGHIRLIGIVRDDAARAQRELGWDDVSKIVIERMRIAVERVNWFSTYHVHHRVAHTFRGGRAFLLGDAAHIHSPVGAQGMNTGIGDAINLSWKLAAVLRRGAADAILDTYECERRAFALRLVRSTDFAFNFVTRDGALARFVRLHVIPTIIPRLLSTRAGLRFMFRTLSQTVIEYRHCDLSEGTAGRIRGGDRLPWVELDGKDNFAPLKSFEWQLHAYGEAPEEIVRFCTERGLALHWFEWREAMHAAGFARNALYLVRPDGYVAWADPAAGVAGLAAYLERWPGAAQRPKV